MDKEDMQDLIDLAVNKLMEVPIESIETVELNQTKYDDGSVGWSVNLTFPAKESDDVTSYGEIF